MPPVFRKARKVNNYDLYANHAWYLPGVRGMFVLLGLFLAGSLLGALLIAIFGLFTPAEVLEKYSMVVMYPLSFLPPMVYAANQSQRNSLFETGYKLNNAHFGPFKVWQIVLITIVLTYRIGLCPDVGIVGETPTTMNVVVLASCDFTRLGCML